MTTAATNPNYRRILTWSSARWGRWIRINALLGLLVSLFGQSSFLFTVAIVFGIYALCVGLLQGFVLFRNVRGFRRWLISSVIGFELGSVIILLNWTTLILPIDSGQPPNLILSHNVQLALARLLVLALTLSLAQMLALLRTGLSWLLWPIASVIGIVLPGVAASLLLQSIFGVAPLTSTLQIISTLLAGMLIGAFYGTCTGVALRIISTQAR